MITLHSDKCNNSKYIDKYGIYVHQSYQDFVGQQASIVEIDSEPAINEDNED